MADEIKAGLDDNQVTPETAPKVESITAEERAELETLRKQNELSKNEIVTRDRKLTELQREVKARMSAEEQAKMQAEEERREWLNDIAKTKADALQLDEKHSALIKGSNKDEINSSAEMVKSLIESVSKEKDKTIKALEDKIKILEANGTAPNKGVPTGTKTITESAWMQLSATAQRDFINSGGIIQ